MTDLQAAVMVEQVDLAQQLRGRAQYMRDTGAVKSPALMEQAADMIEALAARREGVLADPARMTWADLHGAIHGRFEDDEREDGDLFLSRAEADALLGWARHFDREAQPRRDEEEKTFSIIRRASEAMEPGEGEAVFYIRVGGEHSHLQTKAKGIEPDRALRLAIGALAEEAADAQGCPMHGKSDAGFDAAIAAIRGWAAGMYAQDTKGVLEAVADDLNKNRDTILAALRPAIPADEREEAVAVLKQWQADTPDYMGDQPKAQHYQRKHRALQTALAALGASA